MSWDVQITGHSTSDQVELDTVAAIIRSTVGVMRAAGLNPTYARVWGNGPSPDMGWLLGQESPEGAETASVGFVGAADAPVVGDPVPPSALQVGGPEQAGPPEAYPLGG